MAWETQVLKVIKEYRNKDGDLKYKWEITRLANGDKHFAPGLQKTSFYKKEGIEARGYAQSLTEYDLAWIAENAETIKWEMANVSGKQAPAAQKGEPAAAPKSAEFEDVPF